MRDPWFVEAAVVLLALAAACGLARDYAGSANDSSRLATTQSLAEHGTFSIDRSMFVRTPDDPPLEDPTPFDVKRTPAMHVTGTVDKVFIGGHYYSHQPPLLSLPLAGWYAVLRATTGLDARTHPRTFCRLMNLASSGLAYALAVWGLWRAFRRVGLDLRWRLPLTLAFGGGTLAVAYAQHVNTHVVLLALVAWLADGLLALADGDRRAGRLVALGLLAGSGYAVEQGIGQLLFLATFLLVAWRVRRPNPVVLFLLAAAPPAVLHHAINYAIGGTLRPIGAVAAYFVYPGSVFDPTNLTGFSNHENAEDFLTYACALLYGNWGLLGYNLALWLALPGSALLLATRRRYRPELIAGLAWAVGAWLLYAVLSNNYGGWSLSVRWLVPLVAPGFVALALLLREYPCARGDFLILAAGGLAVGYSMIDAGPWERELDGYWWIQGVTGGVWLLYRVVRSALWVVRHGPRREQGPR